MGLKGAYGINYASSSPTATKGVASQKRSKPPTNAKPAIPYQRMRHQDRPDTDRKRLSEIVRR